MTRAPDGPADEWSPGEQRRAVRRRYAAVAAGGDDAARSGGGSAGSAVRGDTGTDAAGCCDDAGTDAAGCCDDGADGAGPRAVGYSREDVERVADGANLGLGCGNPTGIADLETGERVLDLGSGGGFDCFLAAREVGPEGRVIGVDMTPEMVDLARSNAEANDADHVEFRLGEIENLPVGDDRVDVVISNCVVNLSPEKRRVFAEAYRVLRPGGRLAITDVVRTAEPPPDLRRDPESVAGCIAGAAAVEDLRETVEDAGFESVSIRPKDDETVGEWSDEHDLGSSFASAIIEAEKPREVAR
ncbi:arsenite S-adenosylmethyltransferase [Halobacteriales archaeon QS_8_69_26]|nr:MAG: arsenite S-adenosylmethyltransferase [Halobacteriales archaeon QS_8_69_26]